MTLSGITKAWCKIIICLKLQKTFIYLPVSATQNLVDRSGQVVADQSRKHSSKEVKGLDMPFKQGLLTFTWKALDKVLTVAFGAHTEHLQFDVLTGQYCIARPPVYFRFEAWLGVQGNKDQRVVKARQSAGIMHVLPHCSVTALKAMFIIQARVDPFCSVALFFWFIFISLKPPVNDIQIWTKYRIGLVLSGTVTTMFFAQCFPDGVS